MIASRAPSTAKAADAPSPAEPPALSAPPDGLASFAVGLEDTSLSASSLSPAPAAPMAEVEPESVATFGSPPPVKQLGEYRLLARIGRGGMADVYLATLHRTTSFRKLVVVKAMRALLSGDPELRALFANESRLAGCLRHPNVVQTYDAGEHDGQHFLVMEFLEGQPLSSLRRRAAKTGALPLPLRIHVLMEALMGLAYAHGARDFDGRPLGIIHRDISAQNIFVTYDGVVKLLDFGIARAVTSAERTRTGVLKGKVAYLAPEQILGLSVDHRVDIYAMGVLLWEAITQRRMWRHNEDVSILGSVARGILPSIRTAAPDAPPELLRACERALAHDPNDRFSTCEKMYEALADYMAAAAITTPRDALARATVALFQKQRAEASALVEQHFTGRREATDPRASFAGRVASMTTHSFPIAVSPEPMTFDEPRTNESTPPATLPERAPRQGSTALTLLAVAIALGAGFATSQLLPSGMAFLRRPATSAPITAAATPTPTAEQTGPAQPNAITSGKPAADTTPKASPSTTVAMDTVTLHIAAHPSSSRIYLDDTLLPENPWVREITRDRDVHRLRVSAPGYVAQTMVVTFNRDVLLDVKLTAAPHDPRMPPAAVPAPSARTEPSSPATTSSNAPSAHTADPVEITQPSRSAPRSRVLDSDLPWN